MAVVRPLRLLPFALAMAWVACGGRPTPLVRRADGCRLGTAESGHSVQVYLRAGRPRAERAFCPGDELRGEEGLTIGVELDRAAYVQAIFVDPRGNAGALPSSHGEGATPHASFWAPSGLLSQSRGEAQLVVVASEAPLREADPALHALFDAIRDTGVVVSRDGRVHTPDMPRTSPLRFDTGAELHADFDAHGVAMIGLSLRTGP